MRRRLLNILRRIGRWVFDELLEVGAIALADYMLVRSRKFLRDAIPYLSAYETVE